MRLAPILAGGAIAACGSFGASDNDTPADAGTDTGIADAQAEGAPGTDSGPCDPTARFMSSERVAGVEDGTAIGMLSPDELSIYVYRKSTDANLFVQKRTSVGAAFGQRIALDAFTTTANEIEPAISADGLRLVFARDTGGGPDLWMGTRSVADATFETPTKLGSLNSGFLDAAPYLTSTTLYFASSRGGGASQLFKASIAGSAFGTAQEMMELRAESAIEQTHPVVSADGKVIYFSSVRTDLGPIAGGLDIFTASKNLAGEFTGMRIVEELSSTALDIPAYASADHCRLYFMRIEGGVQKAWIASRR